MSMIDEAVMRSTDPHRGLEFDLMMQGTKRLAYLFAEPDPRFVENGFVVDPLFWHGQKFLVYRPDDQHLADKWRTILADYVSRQISLAEAHRLRGRLLGYTENQIERYVTTRGHFEPLEGY